MTSKLLFLLLRGIRFISFVLFQLLFSHVMKPCLSCIALIQQLSITFHGTLKDGLSAIAEVRLLLLMMIRTAVAVEVTTLVDITSEVRH